MFPAFYKTFFILPFFFIIVNAALDKTQCECNNNNSSKALVGSLLRLRKQDILIFFTI
jgi:hypothetical protein